MAQPALTGMFGYLLAQQQGAQSLFPLAALAVVAILYIFMIQIPGKKDRQAREGMLKDLKKNDRVITTSGIYGVVTNVRHDVGRVSVRVDDSTNAQLNMALSAIARVLTEDDSRKVE